MKLHHLYFSKASETLVVSAVCKLISIMINMMPQKAEKNNGFLICMMLSFVSRTSGDRRSSFHRFLILAMNEFSSARISHSLS